MKLTLLLLLLLLFRALLLLLLALALALSRALLTTQLLWVPACKYLVGPLLQLAVQAGLFRPKLLLGAGVG